MADEATIGYSKTAPEVIRDEIKNRDIVEMVCDYVETIKSARSAREVAWDDCYKIYRLIHKHQTYIGRSNIFVPEGFEQVEAIAPRVLLSVISASQYFQVKPRGAFTSELKAKIVGKTLEWQLQRAGFFWRLLNFVKQMAIYGRGRAKMYWKVQDRLYTTMVGSNQVPLVNPSTGEIIGVQNGFVQEKKTRIDFSGPFFRTVDPFMLYDDPMGDCINGPTSGAFEIEKIFCDMNHLKIGVDKGVYHLPDKLDTIPSIDVKEEMTTEQLDRAAASGADIRNFQAKRGMRRWMLYEYWGRYDLDGDGYEEECVLTVLNKNLLIRAEANPFWHGKRPYIDCPYISLDGEIEGIGAIEPISGLQYELNDTHNQLMDNKTLINNCMWLMDENSKINPADLLMRPGGIVRTQEMDGLAALRPTDFTQAGFNGLALLKKQIQETNAVGQPMLGIPSAGRQTATEFSGLVQEGSIRIGLVGKMIKERVLKEVLSMAHSMNEQLLDQRITIMLGGEPQNVERETVFGDYEMEALGVDDIGERSIKQQQLVSFFSIAAQYTPQILPMIIKKIWEGFNFKGTEDVDRVIEQMAPMLNQLSPAGSPGAAAGGPTTMADLLKNRTAQGGPGSSIREVR